MSYRRTISIVLTLIGLMVVTASSASATTQITDCIGLEAIANNLSENYELANNIDCSETWSEGFTQIGNVGTPFTGTLDGKGFVIDDPSIAGISAYTGLFSATGSTAVIKNLGVTNASITGSSYTGVLVGYNQGTIQEVFTEGTVTNIDSSYAGGLVGLNSGGDIINSYSNASVSVSGNYGGGLVGYQDTQGTITNSYSTGELSGSNTGGLLGYNMSGTITDSFWDTTTSGDSTSPGGTGKTTAQMKTEATFTNWDFTDIWGIDSTTEVNSGYPYLRVRGPIVTNVTSTTTDGLYGIGSNIAVNVTFSEAVTSTGSVTVTLETGTTDRTCTFTVNMTSSGSCTYTVQAGDSTDDLTVNSITGTIISDTTNYPLYGTTSQVNLADNKTLIIETTVPTVTLTSTEVAEDDTTADESLNFTATFSESVTGFSASDITVSNGSAGNFVTTNDAEYTFSIIPTDDGEVTVNIATGVVQDIAGNTNSEADEYTFLFENMLTVQSVEVNGSTISITYENGETIEYTPFDGQSIHSYVISEDGKKVAVIGHGKLKIYSYSAGITSTKRIGRSALTKSETKVKIKQLYNNYETVVVLTPGKMLVWRLTEDGELKKKATANYENTGTLPNISFNKKKKQIKLKLYNAEKLTWKLKANGRLKVVE